MAIDRPTFGVNLAATFGTSKPIIGMVHLDPLPGAPASDGDLDQVIDRAVDDAWALLGGGVDGLLIENFGDTPYYPEEVPKHVVAAMTRVAVALDDLSDHPFGINVLRNDAAAGLSVAAASGAEFIRVNVHHGVRLTDQGIIEGTPHETVRLREHLGADVAIFADVDVKHSEPLSRGPTDKLALLEVIERASADGIIVSGPSTGTAVDTTKLQTLVKYRDEADIHAPILVGSGVDSESVDTILEIADGAIVGTAFKEGSRTTAPVDRDRVADLVRATENVRR